MFGSLNTLLLGLVALSDAASVSSRRQYVTPEKLVKDVSIKKLMRRAHQLQDIAMRNGGNRKWGSKAHWKTLKWIEHNVRQTGYYDVYYQYFNISSSVYDKIAVDVSDGTAVNGVIGFNGGSNGTVSGELVYVPNLGCEQSDFPSDVAGKVAFLQRGVCPQGQKNAFARAAGAIGVVSYNDNNPPPDPPTLGEPSEYDIPEFLVSAFISKESGEQILQKIQGGSTISATITSVVHIKDTLTANLIAETKCGNHNQVITTGAHTDSVKAGPGINDDGSGTISQMEVAIALAKYEVKNAVRWCWWSAEEDGLLGSYYYTEHLSEAEAAKIVLNMDFDMLASDNYALHVYDGDGSAWGLTGAPGSDHLEQTFINYFTSIGKHTVPKAFNGRSDYAGFIDIGIPAGGIATGAEVRKKQNETEWFGGKLGEQYDTCYHMACDTVDNLSKEAWTWMTQAMADGIARYARSIKGFPFPRPPKTKPTKRSLLNSRGSMVPSDRSKPPSEY